MKKNLCSISFTISFLCAVIAVFPRSVRAEQPVKLSITSSFAATELKDEDIPFQAGSAMELLRRKSKIQTAYAGAFVTQINGVPSVANRDGESWFYYVNGVLANIGATGYDVQAGDHIWWDYHDWTSQNLISAVIGAYPQPFLNGYQGKVLPTMIISTPSLEKEARSLADNLQKLGVSHVGTSLLKDGLPSDDKHYYIVIGPWTRLAKVTRLADLYRHRRKTGFHVEFTADGALRALDVDGEHSTQWNKGSAILALNSSYRTNPLWLITGSDKQEVSAAISLLTKERHKLKHHSAAVLADGKVHNVPIFKPRGS